MKVVQNSKTKLVLENRPVKLTVGLAVGLLFIIGASIGLIFDNTIAWGLFLLCCTFVVLVPVFLAKSERTRLTLDLTANNVQFQRKTIKGWTGESYSLEDLHCAEIDKYTDREGTSYRPVVSFTARSKIDQIALVNSFAAPKAAQEAVDAVNKWLDRARQSVRKAG